MDFIKEALSRSANGEGRIVSSGDLTNHQIAWAQSENRFYVDPDTNLGWALIPWDLTTTKDEDRAAHRVPSVKRRRVFVIAGNHHQYAEFIQSNKLNIHEFIYVNDRHKIMGCRGAEYILVGEYYHNPVYNSDELRIYDMKKVTLKDIQNG